MTREQAIDIFEDNFTVLNTHGHYTENEENEAIELAVSALSAMEKIRAEIEQYKEKGLSEFKVCYWDYVRAIDTALSIIDKYIGGKAE